MKCFIWHEGVCIVLGKITIFPISHESLLVFPFLVNDIPNTLSWDLKVQQAKEQCVAWGIEPAETLEEMWGQLRTIMKAQFTEALSMLVIEETGSQISLRKLCPQSLLPNSTLD